MLVFEMDTYPIKKKHGHSFTLFAFGRLERGIPSIVIEDQIQILPL